MTIKGLIKNFPGMFQFYKGSLNKFVLLMRRDVYPYEYIDDWEKFNETSLPDKTVFYSQLNLEDITDKHHEHAQKVWDVFNIKNIGEYHHLYVHCDKSFLADVFENFRDKCTEIYELDPAHFFVCARINIASMLEKD